MKSEIVVLKFRKISRMKTASMSLFNVLNYLSLNVSGSKAISTGVVKQTQSASKVELNGISFFIYNVYTKKCLVLSQ
jgi:hypothetical protein